MATLIHCDVPGCGETMPTVPPPKNGPCMATVTVLGTLGASGGVTLARLDLCPTHVAEMSRRVTEAVESMRSPAPAPAGFAHAVTVPLDVAYRIEDDETTLHSVDGKE